MSDMTAVPSWMASPIKGAALRTFFLYIFGILLCIGISAGTIADGEGAQYVWVPIAALVALFALKTAASELKVYLDPARSDTVQHLLALGNLDELAGRIQEELHSPDAVKSIVRTSFLPAKTASLTKNWILLDGLFEYSIRSLDDLAWAHLKQTTKTMHGMASETVETVVFYFLKGDQHEVDVKSGTGAELLRIIHEARPWVVLGYDEKTAALWKNNFLQFIDIVLAKRKEARRAS